MNKKKLKIAGLFAAFGLAVMTGCSTDEVLNGEQLTKGNEISFRVSETRTGTSLRAGIADATTITNFTLSGITDADNTLLDGVVVTRSSDGSTWDYAPKAVWPAEGTKVDFYAYSPGNSRNVSAPGFKGNQDHTITYTVPTQHNGQEDFLVAVQEHTVTSGAQEPVMLNFKHALSRVLVNARADISLAGVEVIVNKVVFKNLASTGTLKLEQDVPSEDGNPARNISTGIPINTDAFKYADYTEKDVVEMTFVPAYVRLWTADTGTRTDYPIDMRGLNGIRISNDGNTYTALTGEMGALMVIPQQTEWSGENELDPQDMYNDFWVEISYSVNGSDYLSQKRVRDFWKRTGGSFCFEAGKAYEFNLVIGGSGSGGQNPAGIVEVTVGVNDWYTQPEGDDGIDVDRRYAVGDRDPDDKLVVEVDEHGRITKILDQIELPYSVKDNDILVALLEQLRTDLNNTGLSQEEQETYIENAFAYNSNYKQKEYEILSQLLAKENPKATLLTKTTIPASIPTSMYYELGNIWSADAISLVWYESSSWVYTSARVESYDGASWELSLALGNVPDLDGAIKGCLLSSINLSLAVIVSVE